MTPVTRSMKRTPKFRSIHDVTFSEVFTLNGDEIEFSHTSLSFVDGDFNTYAGQFIGRKYDLTLDEVNSLLQHIPEEEIYPEPPPHVKLAPACLDRYHIKQPSVASNEEIKESHVNPKIILAEVTAMEMLSETPHPNIAKYHGCIVKRGRLVGIVLDKYASTLENRVVEDSRPFCKTLFLRQLKSAIDHVHSLGLAHNDINPNNIMVDENDTTFLIDFGSCKPIDGRLISAGSLGWMEEGSDYWLSKKSHDLAAFSKLQKWIENPSSNAVFSKFPEWYPVR
ncbi:hypothetical protein ONS95_014351 [Cadophora gregata]|uniref:uncharacterized protein n=1 Tax=Cadophora gregata TaxID=51156 RepID=UPI0026DBC1C2|nr:uncharacterized protein ONS95_014351 [Cadophora gregata]KAK0112608.1 hypothetical protein ONS95_014351 [Cadophora gregata]